MYWGGGKKNKTYKQSSTFERFRAENKEIFFFPHNCWRRITNEWLVVIKAQNKEESSLHISKGLDLDIEAKLCWTEVVGAGEEDEEEEENYFALIQRITQKSKLGSVARLLDPRTEIYVLLIYLFRTQTWDSSYHQ